MVSVDVKPNVSFPFFIESYGEMTPLAATLWSLLGAQPGCVRNFSQSEKEQQFAAEHKAHNNGAKGRFISKHTRD